MAQTAVFALPVFPKNVVPFSQPGKQPDDQQQQQIAAKPFVCPHDGCGRRYVSIASLQAHLHLHETGEKPFMCSVYGCKSGFTFRSGLAKHMRLFHADCNAVPFTCQAPLCELPCDTIDQLEEHMTISHPSAPNTPPPPVRCNVTSCSQDYPTFDALRAHFGDIHGLFDLSIPEPCDDSDKPRRQRTRKYVCEVEGCGKRFCRSDKLKDHMCTHTGERPHICSVCERAFAKRCNLIDHMRIHTGQRPYSCPHPGCTALFAHPSVMRRHVERKHGVSGAASVPGPAPPMSQQPAAISGLPTHVVPAIQPHLLSMQSQLLPHISFPQQSLPSLSSMMPHSSSAGYDMMMDAMYAPRPYEDASAVWDLAHSNTLLPMQPNSFYPHYN
eukprot:TRINITY_DN6446_c0_g1_i1.p1 TRINITY_DN6446_c0_g1~~TRINITY_DN6446_c0_g1_i1.p1  ORF type:complete len:398 (+),score=35.05 TRINITY_DN6446_c0_g1_i1:45-1196(+)